MSSTRISIALVSLASLVALVAGCANEVPGEENGTEEVVAADDAIVGGTEATPGAWPGTVALYMGSQQGCGGTLVHASWVLTAAHCVSPSSATGGISKVVIGRHKLSTSSAGETRTVDRVIRHASYNGSNLDNDIALLHLSSPSTGALARIASSTQAASTTSSGAKVTVVGWGTTSEGGRSSDVLRQVTVPVITNTSCKGYDQYEGVTANQICAGLTTGGKDSCQGDSGGPLFATIGGAPAQVGVVSWGIGCARRNAPGVYTRLGNYLSWMKEKSGGAIGSIAAN